jgi:hypothetical protein
MQTSTRLYPTDVEPLPLPPRLRPGSALTPSADPTLAQYQLHLRRVGRLLKERYSHIPFYAERAARWGDEYWIDLAASSPGILPGNPIP